MPRKKLYLYSAFNKEWNYLETMGMGDRSGALLTVPIDSFPRTRSCVTSDRKTRDLLTEENIGKKFDIKILDPVYIKDVEYRGKVRRTRNFSDLPSYIHDRMCKEKFFGASSFEGEVFRVFKKGNDYIVVNEDFIQVKLCKEKKK